MQGICISKIKAFLFHFRACDHHRCLPKSGKNYDVSIEFCKKKGYLVVAVTSSGILKAKQKLGITFNSDKLGGIDFTKFSKLTMCSA